MTTASVRSRRARKWKAIDKKNPDERRASDSEAIAYDKCARALTTLRKRTSWKVESERAVGRIVSMLADRFDARMPATHLRKKVED
jgi:hypothetical protein